MFDLKNLCICEYVFRCITVLQHSWNCFFFCQAEQKAKHLYPENYNATTMEQIKSKSNLDVNRSAEIDAKNDVKMYLKHERRWC